MKYLFNLLNFILISYLFQDMTDELHQAAASFERRCADYAISLSLTADKSL